jgi:hypothetical protein
MKSELQKQFERTWILGFIVGILGGFAFGVVFCIGIDYLK